MAKIEIIAAGRLKNGPYSELVQDYQKRLRWDLNIIEIESKHKDAKQAQNDETEKTLIHLKNDAFIIALDERGKTLRSVDFAKKFETFQCENIALIQFVIGGADGLQDTVKSRANLLLSFGASTWPHLLVRVMLLEQIYRAQQILAGHPYHRE